MIGRGRQPILYIKIFLYLNERKKYESDASDVYKDDLCRWEWKWHKPIPQRIWVRIVCAFLKKKGRRQVSLVKLKIFTWSQKIFVSYPLFSGTHNTDSCSNLRYRLVPFFIPNDSFYHWGTRFFFHLLGTLEFDSHSWLLSENC